MPESQSLPDAAPIDLCRLSFGNSFALALPADPLLLNEACEVRGACFTRVDPTPVRAPELLGWASAVRELPGAWPPDSRQPGWSIVSRSSISDGESTSFRPMRQPGGGGRLA